jgi:hypothetical protein
MTSRCGHVIVRAISFEHHPLLQIEHDVRRPLRHRLLSTLRITAPDGEAARHANRSNIDQETARSF